MLEEDFCSPGWVLVQPQWGLCNRLRSVVAGQMLADHLERQFVLDWQALPGCNCRWTDLFSTKVLEVADLDEASHPSLLAGLELLQLWDEVTILAKRQPDSEELRRAVRGFNSFHRECFRAGLAYVIDPASEKWRSCKPFGRDKELPNFLKVDCLCVRAFNPFYPPREEDRAALAKERAAQLNRLRPIPELQRRLWQLPRGTVSVHIRRTDHAKAIARSPEELFWHTMESYPQDVSFFLATDDPDVEERMKSRFGSRLLTAPKNLNRNSPTGIQDALIDLLLLSQGIEVLGSFKSSFSAMASHFHMVPLRTMDVSPTPVKPTAAFREVAVVPLDPEEDEYTDGSCGVGKRGSSLAEWFDSWGKISWLGMLGNHPGIINSTEMH
ncbi:unnamed protein product [Cladocopium goreaui]|uniref:Uncharacterized protein n=1 Tax=Cladocopium goreaui TaxID=2562237 RepID=A0A9P1GL52_9DINO|nr:unnamed protein product [Cladocopium goreaui]